MALRNSLTVNFYFFSDFIINMFLTKILCLSNNKIVKYIYSYKFKYRDNSVSSLKMVTVNSQQSDLNFVDMIQFSARIKQQKN